MTKFMLLNYIIFYVDAKRHSILCLLKVQVSCLKILVLYNKKNYALNYFYSMFIFHQRIFFHKQKHKIANTNNKLYTHFNLKLVIEFR